MKYIVVGFQSAFLLFFTQSYTHTNTLQVIATYIQQSETSARSSSEQISTSYKEGAHSFPHIPEDYVESDTPGLSGTKCYATRSSTSAQKQKVSGLGNHIKCTYTYMYGPGLHPGELHQIQHCIEEIDVYIHQKSFN